MSFMYKSMVSRAPGKRKIKLQEENILRLMQEEDDGDEEDDCDFKVTDDKSMHVSESSSDEESNSETSESSKSSSAEEDEPHSSNTPTTVKRSRTSSRHRHKLEVVAPTIQGSASFSLNHNRTQHNLSENLKKVTRQWESIRRSVLKHISKPVLICCICLSSHQQSNFLVCQRCGIAAHQGCYDAKSGAIKTKHWFCESCLSQNANNCELCATQDGCLKQTSNGHWCHVICARYILGNIIYNENNLIDFSLLNTKLYGSKECILCDDPTMTKTGICVKCDAGLCKSFFHVTCAQKYGLLSENDSHIDSETDPYFVYCPLHITKENMVQSQKLFITAFESVEKRLKQNSNESHELQTSFVEASKQLQVMRTQIFKPRMEAGQPLPRLLSSNAAVMRMFNHKAEKSYNINPRSSSAYFPRPSDVRKRHRVAPALTPEFASHFADRELRIMEYKEHLKQSTKENQQLLDLEAEYRSKYQIMQQKLDELKEKEQATLVKSQNLFTHFVALKQWAMENQNNKSGSPVKLKMEGNALWKQLKSPQRKRPSQDNIKSRSPKMAKTSPALINSCDICRGNNNQHMLIDCGICMKWFHLDCLDPPLLQMPKRTKFSLWQCEKCAPSSDSDSDGVSHGSLVTPEGRRITRRSHRPPDKLAAVSDTDIVQQQKMISYFSSTIKKPNLNKRIFLRKALKRKKKVLKKSLSKPKEQQSSSKSGALPGQSPTKSLIIPLDRNSAELPKTIQENSDRFFATQSKHTDQNKTEKIPQTGSHLSTLPSVSSSQVTSNTNLHTVIRKLAQTSNNQSEHNTSPVVKLQGNFFQTKAPSASKPILLHTNRKIALSDPANPFQSSSPSSVPAQSNDKAEVKAEPMSTSNKAEVKAEPMSTSNKAEVKAEPMSTSNKAEVNAEPMSTSNGVSSSDSNGISPACKVCKSEKSVDKMMLCGKCSQYIHIWCSDPPLRFVPRTTKFCLWECSDCCSDTENQQDAGEGGLEQTEDGRKRITRRRRPPEKFSHLFENVSLQRKIENQNKRRLARLKKQESSPKSKPTVSQTTESPNKSSSMNSSDDGLVDAPSVQTFSIPVTASNDSTKGGTFHMPLAVMQPDLAHDSVSSRLKMTDKPDGSKNSLPSIIKLYSQMTNNGEKTMYKVNYGKPTFGQHARLVVRDGQHTTKTLNSIKQLMKNKNQTKSPSALQRQILLKTSGVRKVNVANKPKIPNILRKSPLKSSTLSSPIKSTELKPKVNKDLTSPKTESSLSKVMTAVSNCTISMTTTTATTAAKTQGATGLISVSSSSDKLSTSVTATVSSSQVESGSDVTDTVCPAVSNEETSPVNSLTLTKLRSEEHKTTETIDNEKAVTFGEVQPTLQALKDSAGDDTNESTHVEEDKTVTSPAKTENTTPPSDSVSPSEKSDDNTVKLALLKHFNDVTNNDLDKNKVLIQCKGTGQHSVELDEFKLETTCDKDATEEKPVGQKSDSIRAACPSPNEMKPLSHKIDNAVCDELTNTSNNKQENTDAQTQDSKLSSTLPPNLQKLQEVKKSVPTTGNSAAPNTPKNHTEEKKLFPRMTAKQPEKITNLEAKKVACATVRLLDGKRLAVHTAYAPVIPTITAASTSNPDLGSLKLMENIVKSIPPAVPANKLVTLVLSRPINSPTSKATSTMGSKELNVVKAVSVPVMVKHSTTSKDTPS